MGDLQLGSGIKVGGIKPYTIYPIFLNGATPEAKKVPRKLTFLVVEGPLGPHRMPGLDTSIRVE